MHDIGHEKRFQNYHQCYILIQNSGNSRERRSSERELVTE